MEWKLIQNDNSKTDPLNGDTFRIGHRVFTKSSRGWSVYNPRAHISVSATIQDSYVSGNGRFVGHCVQLLPEKEPSTKK